MRPMPSPERKPEFDSRYCRRQAPHECDRLDNVRRLTQNEVSSTESLSIFTVVSCMSIPYSRGMVCRQIFAGVA